MDYYRLSFFQNDSTTLDYEIYVSLRATGERIKLGRAKKTVSKWTCINHEDVVVGNANSLIHASEILMLSNRD
jgi:hypothetical protein